MGFTLYDFQREDVERIYKAGSGAIASEMGTGKTHEAIALDEAWWHKKAGPTLIVAPINTWGSWRDKYALQSPDADVVTIDRKNRGQFLDDIRRARGDVYLMHWDALRLLPQLRAVKWNLIVADEAHRASNRKAQQTQALKQLKANHRLAMSGTLSGDKPDGLWSPFNWIWPSYYRSYWKFRKHYCVEETDPKGGYTKITGVKNAESLHQEIAPWYVRHLKKEQCCAHHPQGVMWWLPEKTYDTIEVDLSPKQRAIYEQMRREMVAWVNEHQDTPLVASVVVAQLTRLSQMALATPRVDTVKKWEWREDAGGRFKVQVDTQVVNLESPSSKIEALLEKLRDNPTKKFVVWSSSKKMVYLTAHVLSQFGIGAHALTGDTSDVMRHAMVERFVNDNSQVFLGVIAAASEGIDGLQYATDTAIFLDRSWISWQNKQAEDRLDRDGQKNTVQIIDIIARNTVDGGRHQKLEMKWNSVKAMLGDK